MVAYISAMEIVICRNCDRVFLQMMIAGCGQDALVTRIINTKQLRDRR
jgi:hypothetical protein